MRKRSEMLSIPTVVALVGLAAFALYNLYREGPPMRRYLRMIRM